MAQVLFYFEGNLLTYRTRVNGNTASVESKYVGSTFLIGGSWYNVYSISQTRFQTTSDIETVTNPVTQYTFVLSPGTGENHSNYFFFGVF